MLKTTMTVTAIAGALLLSGCGAKPQALIKNHDANSLRVQVSINNGAGTPSWAANESKAFRNALEVAASTTLVKNYKYFAFIEPKEISNFDGSLLNTAEEILNKCLPNSLLALSIPGTGGLHKCGAYNTNARLSVVMFNEEQKDFTVFNAQEVLDYMKEKDLYEGLEVDVKQL